jgi:Tfp pilus assembly protein PilZ
MTSVEKRNEVRIPVEIGTQLRKGSNVYLGTVLNLSLNGMFVKVPALFDEGDTIDVIFDLPQKRMRIEAQAEIRWKSKVENSPVFGVGLLFTSMLNKDREALGAYISKSLMLV